MNIQTKNALEHIIDLAKKSAVPEITAMFVAPKLIPQYEKEQESFHIVEEYISKYFPGKRNDEEDVKELSRNIWF